MNKKQLSNKRRVIFRIEQALLEDYPQYWKDALSFALACVQESYPLFNSRSTVDVMCPINGNVRPVRVEHLYNGHGVYLDTIAKCAKATDAEVERYHREGRTESQLEAIRKAQRIETERVRREGPTDAQRMARSATGKRTIVALHNGSRLSNNN